METGFAKAFRIIVITLACIEYGILGSVILWALCVQVTQGPSDMPFHLLAAIMAAGAAVTGLVPGFITYAVACSRESRKVAFTWGALAALLGPALGLGIAWSIAQFGVPTWLCFTMGAMASLALTLVIRAAATPRGKA